MLAESCLTCAPARSAINYLFELPWHDLSWLSRGLKLSEFQSQCTAFDNAGVTAEHPKLCLLTLTPEVNIKLVRTDPQILNGQIGKPFRKQGIDVEFVSRRIRQESQHRLREHEGRAGRPGLRHVRADVLHRKVRLVA